MTEPTHESETERSLPIRILVLMAKIIGGLLLGVVIFLLCAWSIAALYYSNLPAEWLRIGVAAAFGLGTVAAFALRRRRLRTTWQFFIAFAVVLVYWLFFIPPSFEKDWAVDVAVMPDATIEGDKITVHNIRNFHYRSETDFDVAYYDKTFDLEKLNAVDLLLSYWDGNRGIAHMMVSFGFEGGDWLTISIETRRTKTQSYSAIAGFFKQYELIYVAADERDVIQLRTNHRGEDTFLYPMVYTPAQRRSLFMSLITRIDEMAERPEWYNALDDNCTTAWVSITDRAGVAGKFDIRFLLNGYLDQMGYERGRLVADESNGLPYEEMRAKHAISKIAQDYGGDPEWSKKVRARLPKRTP